MHLHSPILPNFHLCALQNITCSVWSVSCNENGNMEIDYTANIVRTYGIQHLIKHTHTQPLYQGVTYHFCTHKMFQICSLKGTEHQVKTYSKEWALHTQQLRGKKRCLCHAFGRVRRMTHQFPVSGSSSFIQYTCDAPSILSSVVSEDRTRGEVSLKAHMTKR